MCAVKSHFEATWRTNMEGICAIVVITFTKRSAGLSALIVRHHCGKAV